MSRQPQMSQGETSAKRQIFSIIIITGIVFAAWWSIYGLIDLFKGGSRGRYKAQENLDDEPGGDYGLYDIPWPPFPDLPIEDLLNLLDPNLLAQLLDLLSGNLQNLDPSFLASLLASNPALLLRVMFRVYDYPNLADVQSRLFRYSVYDSFSDTDWSKTDTAIIPSEYQTNRILPDVTPEYRLRIPLGVITPSQEYSITIPTVSPDTSIRQGSVQADYPSLDPGSIQTPHVDSFGVKYLKPIFNTNNPQNISLRTWGFERSGGSVYYNINTRTNPNIIEAAIRFRYLTFPGGVSAAAYAASRPNFAAVVAELQSLMNPSANLYVKANIIRNYVQGEIYCDPTAASEASDIVEDVCEHRMGDYTGLVSTYVMLARYFQIPTRFVMGYNGNNASETVDSYGNTVEIRLLNMCAWAEVFMPVQDDGTGDWVSMKFDVAVPIQDSSNQIRLFINGMEYDQILNFYSVDRPATVTIAVNVTEGGNPYNGPVTLYDLLEERSLTVITTSGGWGEFLWNIDTTVLAGGHGIRATAGSLLVNYTGVGVRGTLNLEFESRTPDTIDRSSPNQDLRVVGYVQDIAYTGNRSTNRVPKVNISVDLFTNPGMTYVTNPFTPNTIKTNETGEFASNVTLNPSVLHGSYYIRLNFIGLFTFGEISAWVSGMSASSITRTLEVNDPTQVIFNLYVAGHDYTEYTTLVKPGEQVLLTAQIIRGGLPGGGISVDFSYRDSLDVINSTFGSNNTDPTGWTSIEWTVPAVIATGPAVIRAHFYDTVSSLNRYNDTYCVVNRSIDLGFWATPTPTDPVYLDSTTVSFTALLNDSAGNPVGQAVIRAVILNSFNILSGYYFTPNAYRPTSTSGLVTFNENVMGSGAFTTYYVDLWFNQTFLFTNPWFQQTHGYNPVSQQVPGFANDNAWQCAIEIRDPSDIQLRLWINGTPTRLGGYSDINPPMHYTKGEQLELRVQALQSGIPQNGQTIRFYDLSNGSQLLGQNTTIGAGNASFTLNIPLTAFSGPHHLRAYWVNQNRENFTVAFVDSPSAYFNNVVVTPLSPNPIARGVTLISVTGYLRDANSCGIFRGEVNLVLLNSIGNSLGNGYFTYNPPTQATVQDGSFTFSVRLSNTLHYGDYSIRVDFNRTINALDFNPCPTFLTSTSGFLAENSSQSSGINLTARVQFSNAIYSPAVPTAGENITVSGRILWDNGTALDTSYISRINMTVWETSNPTNILVMTNLATNGSMLIDGSISIQVKVTWLVAFTVEWKFYSLDNHVANASQVATGI